MAEAPTALQTPAIQAPANDWDRSMAHLDQVMEEAALAANAQRDLEATNTPITAPAEPAPAPADEVELPDDEPEPTAASPGEQPQEEEREEPTSPQPDKRYSRRDAARLDQQLQETTRELNELRGRVSNVEASDQRVLGRLADLTGADSNIPEQSTYHRLSQKVLNGTASDDERRKVAEMTEWRSIAGPVYRVASKEVWDSFAKDYSDLKKLDGVTEPVYQELLQAPNPAAMLRRVFELGRDAGRRQTALESKRLEAANTSLRTRTAAERPQPVPATNGNAPKPQRLADQMFRRVDGRLELDPEFEKRAERGEFLGVDLTR
jgi:hypothetical protein